MRQLEVFSPAKINLFLGVLGKMESGFHELLSLVAPVNLSDKLRIRTSEGRPSIQLVCDDPNLPTDQRNLAFLAAERFLERYELELEVEIELEKRIPLGAGLGGGSSNASSVIKGLAELSGVSDQEDLEELACSIGSDCPLFLRQRPLVMRGRGELLEDLSKTESDLLRGKRLLLFKPSFSVGTAWAYQALSANPANYDSTAWAETRLRTWREKEISLEALLHNTFEKAVFTKYPALEALAIKIREEHGARMLMSGSGSACFILLDEGSDEDGLRHLMIECWGEHAMRHSVNIL